MDLSDTVVKQFDGIASFYDDRSSSRQLYLDKIDDRIVAFLQDKDPKVMLDIGTGSGTRAAGLKKQLSLEKMYACDVSPEMVKVAQEKGLDDVQVVSMEKSMPYQPEQFDAITCLFNVFGYVYPRLARQKALLNVHEVLKPGGYFIIDVLHRWNLGEGKGFKKPVTQVLKELTVSLFSRDLQYGDVMFDLVDEDGTPRPAYFHSFTRGEMKSLLRNAGFKVLQEEIIGYDSGETKKKAHEGQLFYICERL